MSRSAAKDVEVNRHGNVQKMHIANSDKPMNFYTPYSAPPESVVAIFATTAIGC